MFKKTGLFAFQTPYDPQLKQVDLYISGAFEVICILKKGWEDILQNLNGFVF